MSRVLLGPLYAHTESFLATGFCECVSEQEATGHAFLTVRREKPKYAIDAIIVSVVPKRSA
jgi:hypothetical protein